MLRVLSFTFINHPTPFIYLPFLNVTSLQKNCHLANNHLIKIDDSSINYSGRNRPIVTQLGATLGTFMFDKILHY